MTTVTYFAGKSIVALALAAIQLVLASVLTPVAAGQAASVSSYRVMRKAVQNEIKSADDDAHFLFRSVKTTPQGSTTRLYVETKEATAGLVIAYNGKPLTAEQRQAEEARVERFLKNPEEMRKKREEERNNAERTRRIIRAMPDAFVFDYAGGEAGTKDIGRPGAQLVKLNFRPNPHYHPPSHVEEVLIGMQGWVLIDAVHDRIASIDGTLSREVGFGWGILGHLDSGGRFAVQQQEVDGNSWEISAMTLKFTGRILLVKALNISSTEVFSGFRRVPADLTFAQALELLKKEESTVAENAAGNPAGP